MARSFLVITGNQWTAKNKLQEAFQKFMWSKNQVIFDNSISKAWFIKEIEIKVSELNKEFSRCKPLDFHKMLSDEKSECYGCFGILHFSIYNENVSK
jgi:hypothetical protein